MEEATRKVDRLNKQHSKVVLPAEGGVIVTPQRPQTMDKASWVWRLIYDIWLYFFLGMLCLVRKSSLIVISVAVIISDYVIASSLQKEEALIELNYKYEDCISPLACF